MLADPRRLATEGRPMTKRQAAAIRAGIEIARMVQTHGCVYMPRHRRSLTTRAFERTMIHTYLARWTRYARSMKTRRR